MLPVVVIEVERGVFGVRHAVGGLHVFRAFGVTLFGRAGIDILGRFEGCVFGLRALVTIIAGLNGLNGDFVESSFDQPVGCCESVARHEAFEPALHGVYEELDDVTAAVGLLPDYVCEFVTLAGVFGGA